MKSYEILSSFRTRRTGMEQEPDRWIGIDEASAYLGVTKDSIHNWIRSRELDIPAHKIGKLWKFKKSELDSWVKSGKSAL
ncbi:helix-turn-helix domain-containing protein [Bowdeniella nasicola]